MDYFRIVLVFIQPLSQTVSEFCHLKCHTVFTVADLRLARGTPPGAQILSMSCSFWENLAKTYIGAPPGELAPPPRGNPGSATVL